MKIKRAPRASRKMKMMFNAGMFSCSCRRNFQKIEEAALSAMNTYMDHFLFEPDEVVQVIIKTEK